MKQARRFQPLGDAIRSVTLTVDKGKLQKILNKVHHLFDYEYDLEQFGGEYWMDGEEILAALDKGRGGFKGDCDDFALACRKLCRDADIDSRLVFCNMRPGDRHSGHLVLEVDGWILSNTHKWLISRDDLGWEWVSISGYEKGDPWHNVRK